jgi:hypothetical protein
MNTRDMQTFNLQTINSTLLQYQTMKLLGNRLFSNILDKFNQQKAFYYLFVNIIIIIIFLGLNQLAYQRYSSYSLTSMFDKILLSEKFAYITCLICDLLFIFSVFILFLKKEMKLIIIFFASTLILFTISNHKFNMFINKLPTIVIDYRIRTPQSYSMILDSGINLVDLKPNIQFEYLNEIFQLNLPPLKPKVFSITSMILNLFDTKIKPTNNVKYERYYKWLHAFRSNSLSNTKVIGMRFSELNGLNLKYFNCYDCSIYTIEKSSLHNSSLIFENTNVSIRESDLNAIYLFRPIPYIFKIYPKFIFNIYDSNITNSNLEDLVINDSIFQDVNSSGTSYKKTRIVNSEFRNVNLSNAYIVGADFSTSYWNFDCKNNFYKFPSEDQSCLYNFFKGTKFCSSGKLKTKLPKSLTYDLIQSYGGEEQCY